MEIKFDGEIGMFVYSSHLFSSFSLLYKLPLALLLSSTGSDFGGLNREFVELLSKELFGEESGLFKRLDADSEQAPVRYYCQLKK